MCAYHCRQWCSTAQTRSKPTCSASTACSTHSCITRYSAAGDASTVCASKIIENFMSVPIAALACGSARTAGPRPAARGRPSTGEQFGEDGRQFERPVALDAVASPGDGPDVGLRLPALELGDVLVTDDRRERAAQERDRAAHAAHVLPDRAEVDLGHGRALGEATVVAPGPAAVGQLARVV